MVCKLRIPSTILIPPTISLILPVGCKGQTTNKASQKQEAVLKYVRIGMAELKSKNVISIHEIKINHLNFLIAKNVSLKLKSRYTTGGLRFGLKYQISLPNPPM